MITPLLVLGLLVPPTVAARIDARDLLFETLADELERSRKTLKLADHEAPYYIGYRLVERSSVTIEARFGAVYIDEQQTQRQAAVDVRVGDYTFDSAPEPEDAGHLFDDLEGFRPVREAPVDDDPAALRATLWLLTDQAYKKALSTFLKKQARRVSTVEDKHVDSFSREAPTRHVDPPTLLLADAEGWRSAARRLSARFRQAKHLLDGTVRFSGERVRTWLVTSEGTRVLKEHLMYSVAFDAVGQAPDGMLLEQGETFYASAPDKLPNEAALNAMVTKSLENLAALATAPLADPYTGPAILEPEATGVFFHETIGHRLEGERQNDENEGRTFKGSVGQLIIPAFLTVRDDPSLAAWQGTPLNGHYLYDDQGVAARNVVLVEKGILKTFLTSRTPIEDVNQSNGHGRAQGIHTPMARMGNLIVESDRRVPREQLKAQLLEEVRKQKKPYGLIIRDITGGSTNTSNYGYQAFKGTPRMVYKVDATTGAETLVRGVEMVGTPLTVISKIITTSEEMGVFNGYCGAESGYVPVSAIAPATLFSEIELQRSQRDKERPPLLPPPWATP